jgi:hypothetical protein
MGHLHGGHESGNVQLRGGTHPSPTPQVSFFYFWSLFKTFLLSKLMFIAFFPQAISFFC